MPLRWAATILLTLGLGLQAGRWSTPFAPPHSAPGPKPPQLAVSALPEPPSAVSDGFWASRVEALERERPIVVPQREADEAEPVVFWYGDLN